MTRIRRYPVGQCLACLGWGELVNARECAACEGWRRAHSHRAHCRRCDQEHHVNSDGLCRPCLQLIRETDAAWLDDPVPGQPSQLLLVMRRGQHKYISRPLDMLKGRARLSHERQRPWQRDQETHPGQAKDDPRVCPPAIPGQMTLIRPRRHLTIQHEQRIRHRQVRGYERVKPIITAHAAQHRLGKAWRLAVGRMVRLALAVRDADGDELAGADAVSDLPIFAAMVIEVLRQVDLLQPGTTLSTRRRHQASRAAPRPPRPTPTARSCGSCQSWGFDSTCEPCRRWARGYDDRRAVGRCGRCHRDDLVLAADICRGCTAYAATQRATTLTQPWTQLWLGGPLTLRVLAAPGTGLHTATSAPSVPSRGLVDPAQGTLFDQRRDWTALPVAELPALSEKANELVDQFAAVAAGQRWSDGPRTEGLRTLRILLAWLGADAPIPEVEIMALATTLPGLSAKRVIAFLAEQHRLVPDPTKQHDPDQQRVERTIEELPAAFVDDVRRWVTVLRGEGRRRHRSMSWNTIIKYVGYVRPVLQTWQTEVDGLRGITREHVTLAIKQRKGNVARGVHVGLRSLFRALKQERLIFRDPTKGIVVPAVETLPTNISSDRLRGMLDRATLPITKVVIVLAAVHGLRPTDIARARLADLDLAAGRLLIHRVTGRHAVYLDELSHTLIAAWLRHRRERWPKSVNPHLLVSRRTAMDVRQQSIGTEAMRAMVKPFGVTPSALRTDRILDEARQTADPIHLMRLFGICDETALRYVFAAHPERRREVIR
ncbi:site-specific integrase [Actinoplanes xinjiangensis]|uniref:site-specific integrase n=1 Tax=Actinoplanes xinjiangensis TaxID=512350 RepID=UPI0034347F3B